MALPPDEKGVFTILHSNVDAAGHMPGSWPSLHEAIRQADAWQREADEGLPGNLWRYRYTVYDQWSRQRYRSTINEAQYRQAQDRLQWEVDIERAVRYAFEGEDYTRLQREYGLNYLRLRALPSPGTPGLHSVEVEQPALRCTIFVTVRGPRFWQIQVQSLQPLF